MGSVFSHHSTNADRSASDRRRHKQKIEKAIKEIQYIFDDPSEYSIKINETNLPTFIKVS